MCQPAFRDKADFVSSELVDSINPQISLSECNTLCRILIENGDVLDATTKDNKGTVSILRTDTTYDAYNTQKYHLGRSNKRRDPKLTIGGIVLFIGALAGLAELSGFSIRDIWKWASEREVNNSEIRFNGDYDYYYQLGTKSFGEKAYEKAIKYYDSALLIDSNQEEAWNNKGFNYSQIGEYKMAISSFKQALNLRPSYNNAWHNMAWAYFSLNKLDSARIALDNVKPEGTDGLYFYSLAVLAARTKDYENVIPNLKRAISINQKYLRYIEKDLQTYFAPYETEITKAIFKQKIRVTIIDLKSIANCSRGPGEFYYTFKLNNKTILTREKSDFVTIRDGDIYEINYSSEIFLEKETASFFELVINIKERDKDDADDDLLEVRTHKFEDSWNPGTKKVRIIGGNDNCEVEVRYKVELRN